MEKFDRFEKLVGKKQVSSIKKHTIVVVGCGGVGGYVIEALVRCNILNLILIDYDKVELSNCNRQIIAMDSTLGMLKTEAFKKRIQDINKNCNVICYPIKLTKENLSSYLSKEVSYVVDACDDILVKEGIMSYCLTNSIPFISCMGTGKRIDPSKLLITTLDKTRGDPLARILRRKLKEKGKKIVVCTSLELPKKSDGKEIASSIFVPGSAGLLIASKVISDLLEGENDNNSTNERKKANCSLL